LIAIRDSRIATVRFAKWGCAANILATGLAPTNDLESALLVRLEPGVSTTVVSGSDTSEVGIALVEVYEVGHE
jgi:hypothetical protein